jgi:phenylacetate-CoA ligase
MFTAGDMNLYGRVLAKAIGQIPASRGRLELVLDKVDLTDRLVVRVEGNRVEKAQVRQALFDAYPKVARNEDNGNLILEIETGVDLSDQVKALRIKDKRPDPR